MIDAPTGIAGVRCLAGGVGVALLAAALMGCAGISEQTAIAAFVAPGKFDLYSCRDLEDRAKIVRLRQTELEQLMARSAQGPGGEFVNAIAYRNEYLQARGELQEIAKANTDKQCATKSQWSSQRAVF
jgi:hypothetical protein